MKKTSIDIGILTQEQAADYWDNMLAQWLEHVSNRRKNRTNEILKR